jgi:hypothetical protein
MVLELFLISVNFFKQLFRIVGLFPSSGVKKGRCLLIWFRWKVMDSITEPRDLSWLTLRRVVLAHRNRCLNSNVIL